MPALQPETISLLQYENLPEERRVEVFEGIIFDMASPSREHQLISMELSTTFNNYIRSKNNFKFTRKYICGKHSTS